jgi:hypothetical protein
MKRLPHTNEKKREGVLLLLRRVLARLVACSFLVVFIRAIVLVHTQIKFPFTFTGCVLHCR